MHRQSAERIIFYVPATGRGAGERIGLQKETEMPAGAQPSTGYPVEFRPTRRQRAGKGRRSTAKPLLAPVTAACRRACDCSCLRGSCISSRQLAWAALGRNPPSSGLISDTRLDLAAGAATMSVPSMKTTNRRSWRLMTGPSGSHVVSALATSRLNPRGGPLSASNQGTLRCDPVRSDALPDCGHDVVTLASARWERG